MSALSPSPAPAPLAPEVRLLFACLRWPQRPDSAQAVRELTAGCVDWRQFLGLAEHHRVAPLVFRALAEHAPAIPPSIFAALRDAAAGNARSALVWLSLVRDLSSLLSGAGIPVRILKGPPLALAAYGDATLRHIGDIDLLIPPESAGAADALLAAQGWIRHHPAARLTPRRLASCLANEKDFTYTHPSGFELDLHWRLFRNPQMPGNALAAPENTRPVPLAGLTLRTLPVPHALLQLCVHGALDGWFRLKALPDIAALWTGLSPADRAAATALARAQAVLPELAAALLLARHFAILDSGAIPGSLLLLQSDPAATHIHQHALDLLQKHGYRPGPVAGGSWALKSYELGLRRGLNYRLPILRRVLFRPRVWERFDLPDWLHFAYPLLSPFEWILFHLGRARPPRERALAAAGAQAGGGMRRAWARWRALPWSTRLLLAEAALSLLTARILLKTVPARLLVRWMRRPAPSSLAGPAGASERVRWAILVAARYSPLSFLCFPQALAGLAMLRRRHISGEIVYGVRRSADGRLRAHTWLQSGGRMLLGGETAPLFAPVDRWGEARPGSD